MVVGNFEPTALFRNARNPMAGGRIASHVGRNEPSKTLIKTRRFAIPDGSLLNRLVKAALDVLSHATELPAEERRAHQRDDARM